MVQAAHLRKQWSSLVKTLRSADRLGDAILHRIRSSVHTSDIKGRNPRGVPQAVVQALVESSGLILQEVASSLAN